MIDNFALGITHGLMLLAAFLLLKRDDLDTESGADDATGRIGDRLRRRKGSPPRA